MNYNDYEANLESYKIFFLVCQNGSFSKTAELLNMTQPNISYSIKKLEDILGVKLFERGNNLVLTPEGEMLVPYVEEALTSLKKGEDKVIDAINLKRGLISIGIPSHIGVFLLTDIIKKFNNDYPNIKIKVICKPTKELFRLLSVNDLDIVIDSSPLDDVNINNLTITRISTEKCCFACSKDNDTLLNREVSLSEINEKSLIVPLVTSSSTKKLTEVFNKYNMSLDALFEISTSDMIAEMVSKNLGVGFLFEKTVKRYSELRIINLDAELPKFDIYMIYKDYLLSLASKAFIDFVNKKIKDKMV